MNVLKNVTSWAAVNGRHLLRFDERLVLDTWYVDHWSLRLDARVLVMTIAQVLRRTDVTPTQGLADIGFPLPSETELSEANDADRGPEPRR